MTWRPTGGKLISSTTLTAFARTNQLDQLAVVYLTVTGAINARKITHKFQTIKPAYQ